MPDYQKMYTTLFNAVTDTIEQLKSAHSDSALLTLTRAQQETEDIYLQAP
jgi:hypothetical protein